MRIINIILILCILVLSGGVLVSCSKRSLKTIKNEKALTNDRYIRETLGGIVLDYKKNHGIFPDGFSIAVQASGLKLPRRGDLEGNPILYQKLENGFRFVSYGQNRKFDNGDGDDMVYLYMNGDWVK